MTITEDVFLKLVYTSSNSPLESGGILGGKDQIITHCAFDASGQGYGTYTPNVRFLNRLIQEWSAEGISFYGLFHSHFPSNDDLSCGDVRYITTIMEAAEKHTACLYFPIVIPNSHITVYRAYKDSRGVHIVCDEINIIKRRK